MFRTALSLLAALGLAVAPVQRGPAGGPFFFLQLSDPQFGMFTADGDFSQETANFEFAVAAVNRLEPAFVVITGDLVNKPGDAAQIAEYRRIKAKVKPSIPVYDMPGNHDIGNAPTQATVDAYRRAIGNDRYVFHYRDLTGIVLDSTLIHTPDGAAAEAAAQEAWLRMELQKAKSSGTRHLVVFQHHPWFLGQADEPDQYFNIPLARRTGLLSLFQEAGVKTLVSGHYHQNAVAAVAGIDAVTTGPVGKPLGQARSGMRAFLVTEAGITHQYFEFGDLPTSIDPSTGRLTAPPPSR